ncbi:Monooxygenase 2 [Vitis vinifera]|uniref:Monooxygenase 2 n=1 Tax=Vitis vinifera TaxID=29760 RepID=A0A438HMT6_VITVI|nr:Monooxygenase 2 [Vitis vinifera]
MEKMSVGLERSDGLRATGAALGLFPNAWRALDALGVAHNLTAVYAVRKKAYVTDVATGAVQEVSLMGNNSTSHPRNSIRFSSKPISIEAQGQEGPYAIRLEDGTVITTKVLIGCDGVNSFVARKLGLTQPVNSGRSAFPEGHGVREHVLQFVDVGKRGGIVPLNDKEIYWFLTFNTPKGEAMTGDPEQIQKQVIENYAKDFPPIYAEVVRHCDLSTLNLAPLRLRLPWDLIFGNVSKGNMTVAGDAMHPMTPDLGQGGCSALEDAVVLGRHIGKSFIDNRRLVPGAVARAIEEYVKERRWRTAWLITGSYISGWAQLGGEGWLMKMFRDVILYRFLFKRLIGIADYDCGKLPLLDDQNKIQ